MTKDIVERLREEVLFDSDVDTRANEAADEIERLRSAYNELIYAVSHKYEGETRHETALKYIMQAEAGSVGQADAKAGSLTKDAS